MQPEKESVKPIIRGTFPAQRFFDTLALILSRREGVEITVQVQQDKQHNRKMKGRLDMKSIEMDRERKKEIWGNMRKSKSNGDYVGRTSGSNYGH